VSVKWTKNPGDAWLGLVGPFSMNVQPKGDGRWSWAVFTGESANPTATGVAASLGAAKTATEQFAKRSGLI
jgi:hypothetical protein